MGWSNCTRALAYATVASRIQRALPTNSAANATVARANTSASRDGSIGRAAVVPRGTPTSNSRRVESRAPTGRSDRGPATTRTAGPGTTNAT